ncbi:MAG: metal-dependent transcriptional regulator [Promethearchaeota archaeon]
MSYHSAENLLENQILRLLNDWIRPIRSGDLTRELNRREGLKIRASTVNSALERLEKKKLLNWKRYGLVTLTNFGKNEARALARHHRLIEVFLVSELGLSVEQAHKEANLLNPPLSCETINRICEKYSHPEKCPCGSLIESSEICGCSDGCE